MEKWGTVRAGTGVRGRIACHPDSGADPVAANDAVCGSGAARRAGGRAEEGGSDTGGCGNGGSDAGKLDGRGAGRRAGDAGAGGPAAGTEGRPHESSDCGHHIMLPCAARRAVLGRGAAPSAPGDAYHYSGDYGLPGTGARRRRDEDGRVGARV